LSLKILLADIGELGWSLYLSAHAAWLKAHKGADILVYTFPDRACLYRDSARIKKVPRSFHKSFGNHPQTCFGRYGVEPDRLRTYFEALAPKDYSFPEYFNFSCDWFFLGKMIHKPYFARRRVRGPGILVFPTYRTHPLVAWRNLPKNFWIDLIRKLNRHFPECKITALGTKEGAYDLSECKTIKEFKNLVGKTGSLQTVIDFCEEAAAAIGSASSLPKLALHQGVPTFIIGHERQRDTERENWFKTPVGFFEVEKGKYHLAEQERCYHAIVAFTEAVLNQSHASA